MKNACLFALVLAASFAFGQGQSGYIQTGSGISITNVAGLSAVSHITGTPVIVTDGSTATDCTVGGGSNVVFCHWTGSAWAQFVSGAASAVGANACLQFNSGGSLACATDFTFATHTLTAGASGILDLSGISVTGGLKLPSAAGAAPTADGLAAFDTSAHAPVWGSNGSTIHYPSTLASSAHKYLTSFNQGSGLFTSAQPISADLSDLGAANGAAQLNASGLLNVAAGGSGAGTLTAHGLVVAEGTSPFVALTPVADSIPLWQTATSDPTVTALLTCGDATHALGYSTTTHTFFCQALSGGGGGTPSAPSLSVQFDNAGAFGGAANASIVNSGSDLAVQGSGYAASFPLVSQQILTDDATNPCAVNMPCSWVAGSTTNVRAAGAASTDPFVFGICTANCTAGATNAVIQTTGIVQCTFNNTATNGDAVQYDTTTHDCTDVAIATAEGGGKPSLGVVTNSAAVPPAIRLTGRNSLASTELFYDLQLPGRAFWFNLAGVPEGSGASPIEINIPNGNGVIPQPISPTAHNWISGLNATTGVFSTAQPSYADLSGGPVWLGTAGATVTVGQLVKRNSSSQFIPATSSDTAIPVYIVAGPGAVGATITSGNTVQAAMAGTWTCTMDANASAGDWAIASNATGADCKDSGVAVTAAPPSGKFIVGEVETANSGGLGGTSTIAMLPGFVGGGGGTTTDALHAFEGDGSDGTATFDGTTTVCGVAPSSSIYTLTRDCYFNTSGYTVNNGVTIKTDGQVIYSQGTATINGTISATGNTGGTGGNASGTNSSTGGTAGGAGSTVAAGALPAGTAAVAGVAGASGGTGVGANGTTGTSGTSQSNALVSTSCSAGIGGGTGGSGSGGAGGGAGSVAGATNSTIANRLPRIPQLAVSFYQPNGTAYTSSCKPAGANSGGAGGGDGTNNGGGGGGSGGNGSSGGFIALVAPTITVGATGVITVQGGAGGTGGNGGSPTTGNCGGGGGGSGGDGGNGGAVALIYNTINNSGTVTVSGGSGGSVGTHGTHIGTGTDGTNGNTGNSGISGSLWQLQIP